MRIDKNDSESMKPVVFRFLILFFPVVILIGAILAIIYIIDSAKERVLFETTQQQNVQLQKELIVINLKSIVSDLQVLSSHHELHEFINSENRILLDNISEEFLSFSQSKKIYDQLRLIDIDGMEIIRINYNNGNPAGVPPEKLQNKAKRYYFSDTVKLNRNEIFVSPIDLNI